jgi:DNA-binding NarL/FixJ family response regulator
MTFEHPNRQQSSVAPTAAHRLLIVDDHPIFRHGIRELIGKLPDIVICGEAENSRAALHAMRELEPEMVLVDVSMPGVNGLELIKLMLAERKYLKIVVVSMYDESLYALRALRAGAKGYLAKHQAAEHLVDALRKVAAGGMYVSDSLSERLIFKVIQGSEGDVVAPVDKLSDRELEVFQHIGNGLSTREIAEMLHLSVKTIETHRAHIKEKLGFATAPEMINFAVEWRESSGGAPLNHPAAALSA